jgi:hypothetical protein
MQTICCSVGIVTINRTIESADSAGMRPATLAASSRRSHLSSQSPPAPLPVIG